MTEAPYERGKKQLRRRQLRGALINEAQWRERTHCHPHCPCVRSVLARVAGNRVTYGHGLYRGARTQWRVYTRLLIVGAGRGFSSDAHARLFNAIIRREATPPARPSLSLRPCFRSPLFLPGRIDSSRAHSSVRSVDRFARRAKSAIERRVKSVPPLIVPTEVIFQSGAVLFTVLSIGRKVDLFR